MPNKIPSSRSTQTLEEHTLIQTIFLHLLPGVLGGILYYALAGTIRELGYPSMMAMVLSGIFSLIPVELGFLIYHSKKNNQKLFGEVIRNLDPLPWKDYLIWVPIIIIGSGGLMALLEPVSTALSALFSWLPEYMILDSGLNGAYPTNKLVLTYVLFFIFIVLLGPITEEFYFRGYLLPRIPSRLKGWGPIFHSLLFAIYHIWTPWFVISRTVALLPLIYSVKHKKNIILGVIAHCLLNSIDFFIALTFIIAQS